MINNDRLALFAIATGPRGSLKSLWLTSLQVEKLLKFHYRNQIEGTNFRVWSNYPVEFYHTCEITHKVVRLASLALNMEALYTFDKDLANGWVFIDELDQWFDRQDWNNASQKLTHSALTQVRKKKLSLGATVQDIDWINGRITFQADIQLTCREAAFTPFGNKLGLDLGVASFQKWRDLSGTQTGYMFKETGREFQQTFWGKHFWNCYDTNYQFDPTETRTRYKLKAPSKIIQIGGGEEMRSGDLLPDNVPDLPYKNTKSEKMNRDHVLLADLVQEFKDSGDNSMLTKDFWHLAEERGLQGDKRSLGYYLNETLGMERVGLVYKLRSHNTNKKDRELAHV